MTIAKFTFKKIATSNKSLKEILLESVNKMEQHGPRYQGFNVEIPFAENARKYVRITKSDDEVITLTIVDTQNNNRDVTEYFYKLRFGSTNYKTMLDIHNQVYEFYDWYIKQVVDRQNHLAQLSEDQRYNLLKYFKLNSIFNGLFEGSKNTIYSMSDPDIYEKLNMLKEIIVDTKAYMNLYECSQF